MTDYEKREHDLNSRTPVVFEDEKETHPTTQDSIAWAENSLGYVLKLPVKGNYEKQPTIETTVKTKQVYT